MSAKQGDLFPAAVPRHRDVTAICEACGREIAIARYNATTKQIASEYRSSEGLCFSCAFPTKEKTGGAKKDG